jgi:integrase
MTRTKISKPKGSRFYKLFVEQDGKYKIVFKSESKQAVKHKRKEIQINSVDKAALLNKMTFVELYKQFALHKIEVGKNEKLGGKLYSLKVYLGHYKKWIAPHFNHKILLTEVTKKVAKDFFIKLLDNGASWITAENVVMTFKTALKYAVDEQYISSIGPMDSFSPKKEEELIPTDPTKMKYKKTTMISLQEADRLFKYFDTQLKKNPTITDKRNFAIVSVFLFCGMRMSEVRGLKWNAINFDSKVPTITIKHTLVGSNDGHGKADGSRRTFIIHPVLLEILKEWKAAHTKHFTPHKITWVFPSLTKTLEWIVPTHDRTIRDMLNVAYDALGYAEIDYKVDRTNPSKRRIVVKWSKFGSAPTKTFRHFAATALLAGQNSNKELTDKFVTNYIGHTNKLITENIYGNHTNLNTSSEYAAKELQALENAIPLRRGGYNEN